MDTVRGIKISMMVVTFLFKGVKQTTFKATVLIFVETKILKVRATPLHFLFKIFYFRLAKEHDPFNQSHSIFIVATTIDSSRKKSQHASSPQTDYFC